jgi:hypothetical protein
MVGHEREMGCEDCASFERCREPRAAMDHAVSTNNAVYGTGDTGRSQKGHGTADAKLTFVQNPPAGPIVDIPKPFVL